MTQSLAYGRSIDSLEVVLIQDNRGAQTILRSMISSLRVKRLRVFDRPDDALKQMMNDPPHIIITDWDMNPASGARFLRLVRNKSIEPLCFVPVVVLTANATVSMVDRAFTLGANCVLVKPIAPITMLRRLEWATLDQRGYVLKDDHYMLAGMEEVLEARVRRNEVGDMLERRRAIRDVFSAETTSDEYGPSGPLNGARGHVAEAEPAQPSGETWNSWAMK